jgi:hypothetical protein
MNVCHKIKNVFLPEEQLRRRKRRGKWEEKGR